MGKKLSEWTAKTSWASTDEMHVLSGGVDYRMELANLFASGRSYTVKVVTDTYSVLAGDEIIVCNKATAMSVNLPASTGSGRRISIKNQNTGTVTVDADGSETIDGDTTQDLLQWDGIHVVDSATGTWVVI